ncbi:MAG: transcriptional regulator [Archaeoglobales archaeon]|nr:transcriptional regulator [Archaeoglobales archaeon]
MLSQIISLLEKRPMNAREICDALGIEGDKEREIYEMLKKAAKVLKHKGKTLMMQPPRCKKCGFEFENMKASKCPECRSEWIEPARFFIK